MAGNSQGKQRRISWTVLILTIVFFITIVSILLIPRITLWTGGFGFIIGLGTTLRVHIMNLAKFIGEKVFNPSNNPDSSVKKFIQKLFAYDPAQEKALVGPYDFAILYRDDQWGREAEAFITDALREICIDGSFQPYPWLKLGNFMEAWKNASKAKHCIIVVSDTFLQRIPDDEQGKQIDLEAIRTQLLKQVSRDTSRPEDQNQSEGTLIFLDDAWEVDFLWNFRTIQSDLSTFSLDLSARNSAKEYIQARVPHKHCQIRRTLRDATTKPLPELDPALRVFNNRSRKNLYFVDRSTPKELSLVQLFSDIDTKNPIQILQGPPGCGKTQLALAFAHTYYQGDQGDQNENVRHPYSIILWLDMTKSLAEGINKLNKELSDHFAANQNAGQRADWQAFQDMRDLLAWLTKCKIDPQKHWLLIIDGCKAEGFEKLYPSLQNIPNEGHVIVTTRPDLNDLRDLAAHIRRMEYMSPEEATILLARVHLDQANIGKIEDIRDRRWASHKKAYWEKAGELARVLNYNPYLIGRAANTMRNRLNYTDPQEYREDYEQQLQVFLTNRRYQGELITDEGMKKALTIWTIAHDEIQKHKKAYQILLLCAFLSTENIPNRIIYQMPRIDSGESFHTITFKHDKSSREQALGELQKRAILRIEEHAETPESLWRLENFVRNIIHSGYYGMIQPVNQSECKLYAIRSVNRAFTILVNDDSGQYPYYRPHIGECVGYLEEPAMQTYLAGQPAFIHEEIFQFLFTVGRYLQEHPEYENEYKTDEIKQVKASKIVQLRAEYLFHLAMLMYDTWKIQGAAAPEGLVEQLYMVGHFYHEQFLYRDRAKLRKAVDYYLKASRHISNLNADADLSLAIHLDLGRLYADLGEHEKAQEAFAKVKESIERRQQNNTRSSELSLRLAEVLYSQANSFAMQGFQCQGNDHAKAEQLYKDADADYIQALALLQKLGGAAKSSSDFKRRIQRIGRSCQVSRLALTLHRRAAGNASMLHTEIETSRIFVDKDMREFQEMKKEMPPFEKERKVLEYVQLFADLNTLAEAYRMLAQQRWKKKRVYQQAQNYSVKALNHFQGFLTHYPQVQKQKRLIAMMGIIWGNYKQNPLCRASDTATSDLWKHQSQILDLQPLP